MYIYIYIHYIYIYTYMYMCICICICIFMEVARVAASGLCTTDSPGQNSPSENLRGSTLGDNFSALGQ